ncbi:cation:proton antiporter, partial [Candidatus Binatus sp.]|uniref:cation:proton antiporter domain-containing protein n=1 Tax=Candidatus Binatus sp. TaxID=2811406 RepID=UPI003C5F79FC
AHPVRYGLRCPDATVQVLASHTFLEDLAMVLCVAAITTIIFQKIRQPVVVGYLIAGLIVGPNLPIPLLADSDRIRTLSELGVILLMFALGLEFSVRKLIRLGPTSGFITALQVSFMIWLGYVCGRALGWTPLESIFTGALLSISSTTIVAKAYEETPVSERVRELVFGVLLAEDLTAVVELAILTTLASGASVSASLMTVTIARLILFLVAFVGIGFMVVPPFVRLVVRMGRPETTLVAVVGICFAFAVLAEHAGYSVALGAFLAGSLVAESGQAAQIEHLVAPLRDIFGAVFFVSVGMMIDPALVEQHWPALIVLTAAVIGGKIFGVTFASVLSGVGAKTSIEAGMSLAQIGEFSFIIAGAGLKTGATRDFLYTLAVALSAITTFLTPYMIRSSIPVAEFVSERLPPPLKVLEALYDSWFERIRNAGQPARDANSIGRPIAAIVSSAVLIGAILIVNELDPLDVTSMVASLEHLSYFTAGLYVDLFALLLCAAPAAAMYFASRRLATALASRAFAELPPRGASAVKALIELLQITILLVAAVPLLAIVQPFMEPVEGIGIIVITIALMIVVVTRSARQMQGQIRNAARLIATALRGTRAGAEGESYEVPGIGMITPVSLRAYSDSVGRSLAELDLHTNSGAVVVAIGRGDAEVVVPTGEEILRSGDILELVGSSAAVAAARRLLDTPRRGSA